MNMEKLQNKIYEQVKLDDFKKYEEEVKHNYSARLVNNPGFVFEGKAIVLTLTQDLKRVKASQVAPGGNIELGFFNLVKPAKPKSIKSGTVNADKVVVKDIKKKTPTRRRTHKPKADEKTK